MKEEKKIKATQIGRNLLVKVPGDKNQHVFTTPDKEKMKKVKDMIERYNKLPSQKKLDDILKIVDAKKQKKELALVVQKKKSKAVAKEIKRGIAEVVKETKEITMGLETHFGKDDRFKILAGEVYLKPYLSVPIPLYLVTEMLTWKTKGESIDPLVNFWERCLCNSNPIARNKLFDYIKRHKLIITPHGYFVTFRMVKKTSTPGVYTSARTGKEKYVMGEVFRMPRAECDEDGANDCSRGLHTGTPEFLGITGLNLLGDGYVERGRVQILTKSEGGGQGTGYDYTPERLQKLRSQTFQETFGNQAVIVLVDPMHVVSVPNSDTRKLRACELYFVKTTTPEEVVDMHISSFNTYSNDYAAITQAEIKKKLETMRLEIGDLAPISTIDTVSKKKKDELLKKQAEIRAKLEELSGDTVNKSLSLEEMYNAIKARLA